MERVALPPTLPASIISNRQSSHRHVPFEAEMAVAVFIAFYLTAWAGVFSFLSDDWSLLDGFYFCMVTLTTVGYGDMCVCTSRICRAVAMIFIWTNVLVVSAVLGVIGSRVEREVARVGRIFRRSQLTVHFAALLFFVLVLALGFSQQESKSLLDGFYFSTVTLSTVGYGALAPSQSARLPMCPMLFVSVVSVGSIAGYLAQQTEKRLKRELKQYSKASRAAMSVFVLFVFATVGGLILKYVGQENWSTNEAIYFAIVTMATVGLGDYAPVTTAWQKLSAILFIWLSIILLAVLFGFISAEAESELLGDEATPKLGASRSRRLRPAAWLIGLHVLSAGALMSTESWSLMDSLYFTTVVLTTVGYGDMRPKTDTGRTLTSFLVLAGVPCTAALVHRLSGRFSSRLVREIQKLDE